MRDPLFIKLGPPREDRCIESFDGNLRDELLNGQLFLTLKERQTLVE